ncbi:MAG: hypothetical protein IKG40_01780 [Bacilli bacterium]|nr:hypothetical protein [Bacilli bacterium]
MATKNEFEIIKSMYHRAIGKALIKIEESVEEAKEVHGFENGSALTDIYRNHLDKAMEGIEQEFDIDKQEVVYNPKDSLKMLKSIEYINTYIL